jgi:hypothetical protein
MSRLKDAIREVLREELEDISLNNETATLTFNLEDGFSRNAHKRAVNATNAYIALFNIANEVFRPARKHGYPEGKINKLLDECGETEEGHSRGVELIGELETKFYEILEDNGIDLNDLD